jgi:hypothetical protein
MGQLLTAQVHLARPFLSFGVHYAGPFYGKQRSLGSKIQVKSYVAIFICIAVKAVHLELVSNLSSDALMAALQRFYCTKGETFIFVF